MPKEMPGMRELLNETHPTADPLPHRSLRHTARQTEGVGATVVAPEGEVVAEAVEEVRRAEAGAVAEGQGIGEGEEEEAEAGAGARETEGVGEAEEEGVVAVVVEEITADAAPDIKGWSLTVL